MGCVREFALLTVALSVAVLQAAESRPLAVDAGGRVYLESAYCSTSGRITYTKPVAEQTAYIAFRTRDFGRLTVDAWFCSALNDQTDHVHRRAFYIYEGTALYGYDIALTDDMTLVSDAGGLWDLLYGYRTSQQTPVAWYSKHTLKTPYVSPYVSGLGVITPGHSLRFRLGLNQLYRPFRWLRVTPFAETIWADRSRFKNHYGVDPENVFAGGCFMMAAFGFVAEWALDDNWYVWGRFREMVALDQTARDVVDESSSETMVKDLAMFGLGIGCRF